jgi:protein phosphatase PTC7
MQGPKSIENNPKELLNLAADKTTEIGSSTCCVLMLDQVQSVLHAANLGDSGFLIYRNKGGSLETIARSKEQTHGFNFPFQVGTEGDNPNKAEVYSVNVQPNDIVILGTDGY